MSAAYKDLSNESIYLHATNPNTERLAGGSFAFLALALLLGRCGVHPVLTSTHLNIHIAWMFQPPCQILHQNKVILTCDLWLCGVRFMDCLGE